MGEHSYWKATARMTANEASCDFIINCNPLAAHDKMERET